MCKAELVENAFDGEGAYRYGGRWNSRGTRIVYAAGNLSLTALEIIVHFDDDAMLLEYSYIPAEVPAELILRVEDFRKLSEKIGVIRRRRLLCS